MDIQEYSNKRGDQVISDFLISLSLVGKSDHAKKIFYDLEKLEQYPLNFLLRLNNVKKINKNLYELRIAWRRESYRIFFCIQHNTYYLLHIFCKKSQKIPSKELRLAQQRKNNLIKI